MTHVVLVEGLWREPEGLWHRMAQFAEDHPDDGFLVMAEPVEPDVRRPLLVMVHPGDAVQSREDVAHCPSADVVLAYAAECQTGMAEEIRDLLDQGADVVVLHRYSSGYAFASRMGVEPCYMDVLEAAHESGAAILYGDDLGAAADWIILHSLAAGRADILVTGAWADAEYGCVAAVASALADVGAPVRLSDHSPISPDGSGTRWHPAAREVHYVLPQACP